MKEYWFFWLAALFIIAAYMLGQNDNMEDIVTGCQHQQQFVVDGVAYTCYSFN